MCGSEGKKVSEIISSNTKLKLSGLNVFSNVKLLEAVKHNDRLTELSGIKQDEYLLEIEGYLSWNKEWRERNQQVKLLMILRRRRDGNIVSNFQ